MITGYCYMQLYDAVLRDGGRGGGGGRAPLSGSGDGVGDGGSGDGDGGSGVSSGGSGDGGDSVGVHFKQTVSGGGGGGGGGGGESAAAGARGAGAGTASFLSWFSALVLRNEPTLAHAEYPGTVFVGRDTVLDVYRVFAVEASPGGGGTPPLARTTVQSLGFRVQGAELRI
jgi:hypothetical protein